MTAILDSNHSILADGQGDFSSSLILVEEGWPIFLLRHPRPNVLDASGLGHFIPKCLTSRVVFKGIRAL